MPLRGAPLNPVGTRSTVPIVDAEIRDAVECVLALSEGRLMAAQAISGFPSGRLWPSMRRVIPSRKRDATPAVHQAWVAHGSAEEKEIPA